MSYLSFSWPVDRMARGLPKTIGLFQKISTPHLWTTLNWVPKNFRISKKDSTAVYAGFQTLLIQILREFQNFARF